MADVAGPDLTPASTATAGTVVEADSVAAAIRRRIAGWRAGDWGSLPIIFGLLVICVFFQTKNSNFLSAPNFINVIVQMAGFTTIAIGVVFVLLLGEIDLSIGYVSGACGIMTALFLLPDNNPFYRFGAFIWPGGDQLPGLVAIIFTVIIGAGIGLVHGLIITKLRIPSFVATLAALLFWQGMVLILIGGRGTIIIQNYVVTDTANKFLSHNQAWVVGGVVIALYALVQGIGIMSRRRAGLPSGSLAVIAIKVAAVAAAAIFVVDVCNRDPNRGLPVVGVLLLVLVVGWSFIALRTRFGRYFYAVGGNAEAARRAGVSVDRIRIYGFMISSAMAALGGVILASRLYSVDTEAGGGTLLLDSIAAAVIGGTSLFGGRGKVTSAFLGALVIASVANGMDLISISDGKKFAVTGLILLAAVVVDSLSRRRLAASGAA
jgi:D-xylose transport system permease protein